MTSSNKTSDGAENVPQPTRTVWLAAVLAVVIFSAFAFVFVGVYEQDRSLTDREREVRNRENKVQEREEAEAEEARRVRALREQTSRLKAARTGLQDAVARLSGERAELEETRTQLAALREEKQALDESLKHRASLRRELDGLKAEIADARQSADRANTARDNAIEDRKRAEDELQEIRQRLDAEIESENELRSQTSTVRVNKGRSSRRSGATPGSYFRP